MAIDSQRRTALLPDTIPIYLLPGMTSEFPVFSRLLPLLQNATLVPFIQPKRNESLKAYAARMADHFPPMCYIAGVSFGGILALEISRIVQPAGCILISSVTNPSELPPWLRAMRVFGGRNCSRILKLVGNTTPLIPSPMMTGSTIRLTRLAGDSGEWHRWATSAVLNWTPEKGPIGSQVLQIHGDADTTFPVRYTKPDIVIRNGRHTLPISHPVETANAILSFIEERVQGQPP